MRTVEISIAIAVRMMLNPIVYSHDVVELGMVVEFGCLICINKFDIIKFIDFYDEIDSSELRVAKSIEQIIQCQTC